MTSAILPQPIMSVPRKNSPRISPGSSPSRNEKPFTSFLIKDILNKNNTPEHQVPSINYLKRKLCTVPRVAESVWVNEGLVLARPRPVNRAAVAAATAAFINEAKKSADSTAVLMGKESPDAPLTALEQLTTKTFTGLETSILKAAEAAASGGKRDSLHLLSRQAPRKKRKSRTAFTNHQIFELERRFLYQKYLTPADRDELASTLGLTNAQVITWFQNRRAKLKRDIDELKADLSTKDDDDEEDAATKCLGHMKRKAGQNDKQQMRLKLEKLHISQKCNLRASLPPPLIATEDTRRLLELRESELKTEEKREEEEGTKRVGEGSETELSDSEKTTGKMSDRESRSEGDREAAEDSENEMDINVDGDDDESIQTSPQRRAKSC
ncbi:Transcription factor LBX1 [Holothuria leucospilota]|uniref:Transcription factor LBX1 n=1 Tax=Holothuria leucospilota TaxID=206669 RepID=A0A9Q0YPL4_HOLLE|nr:Transcription factor LBX1 [Holothuria leucospilota]